MMNQGSSEISMMFGVKAVDRKKAVQALYQAFFGVECTVRMLAEPRDRLVVEEGQ